MYQTRSLDVRSQSFDFKRTMGNEGGATNAAPYVIGGNKDTGSFTFGLLFNSPAYGGMDFSDTNVRATQSRWVGARGCVLYVRVCGLFHRCVQEKRI